MTLPVFPKFEAAIAAIKKALEADELKKAEQSVGSPTVKPPGPKSTRGKSEIKTPSVSGLAAPGNTAGPGRPASDASKTTKPASLGSSVAGQEIKYLSKEDFPKAPKGTIGSTPNSWKVPAGIARQLQVKAGDTPDVSTTEQEAKVYSKTQKTRDTLVAHLTDGTIASKRPIGEGNVSETYKVVIQGNGAGLLKPEVDVLRAEVTRTAKEPPTGESGWKFDSKSEKWSKTEKVVIDPYDKKFFGAGGGNLPFRKQPQREVAGYQVAQLHGLDNVPVTVQRNESNKLSSVQEWKEGLKTVDDVKQNVDPHGKSFKEIEVLRQVVSRDRRQEFEQKLMDIAVHDIISNNNDRHGHNYLINEETGDIVLIDHGMAFGNSMHGNRNHFLHNVFHKQKPIKMSESLQKRLKNLSYNDYKRAKPGMYDWEAGQDFLRNRYVVWLQENHGEIDRQKFLHTESSNDGSMHAPGDPSNWSFAGGRQAQIDEFEAREKAGVLPHQLFESWAKAYLQQASADPSHRDYNDAKLLNDIGIFMERGYMGKHGSEENYRAKGLHKKYEQSIVANIDVPKSISSYMDSSSHSRESLSSASTINPSADSSSPVTANVVEDDMPSTAKPANSTAPARRRKK